MGFFRQEYWNGLPFPSPGDLCNPGIEPTSIAFLHWQADSLPLVPPGKSPSLCTPKFIIYKMSKLRVAHS